MPHVHNSPHPHQRKSSFFASHLQKITTRKHQFKLGEHTKYAASKINLSVKQIAEHMHAEQRIVKLSEHEGGREIEEAGMRRHNAS